jgi:hypothetical protein
MPIAIFWIFLYLFKYLIAFRSLNITLFRYRLSKGRSKGMRLGHRENPIRIRKSTAQSPG